MESPLVKFMTRRQLCCKSALDVVCVDNIGGGAAIECFGSAHGQLGQQGVTLVSGWLAEPRQHTQSHCQFTQYWSNFDQHTCEYIDTTPEIEKGAIHILDRDIALFAIDNNARLSTYAD